MTRTFSLLLFSLTACSGGSDKGSGEGEGEGEEAVDSDGDGLDDAEEAAAGTDPQSADSDEDGLGDAEEIEGGTDPLAEDSDGDGYRDADEITEGSDPTDGESWIYAGHWPYYADKDGITAPGEGSAPEEGATIPRFVLSDQYGEMVDIYDFAYQGKPIVIDLSAMWCYYCKEMAAWLEGESSSYGDSFYPIVPELVQNGDVYWITVMVQDRSYNAPTQSTTDAWFSMYPNPMVPILTDVDQEMLMYFYEDLYGFPSLYMLEEDMTFGVYTPRDYTKVFSELESRYGG